MGRDKQGSNTSIGKYKLFDFEQNFEQVEQNKFGKEILCHLRLK